MVHVNTLIIEHAEKGSTFRFRTHRKFVCIYYAHTQDHKDIIFKAKNMKTLAKRTGHFTLHHPFTKGFNPKRIHVSSNELLFAGPEFTLKLRYLRNNGNLSQFDVYNYYTGDAIVYKYNCEYHGNQEYFNNMIN